MPFYIRRRGNHPKDAPYYFVSGPLGFGWSPRPAEALSYSTQEDAEAATQPGGPAHESDRVIDIVDALPIAAGVGPFMVRASAAATGQAWNYQFNGVTATWPDRPGQGTRFASQAEAEAVAARFRSGDGPATAALTAAGLPQAHALTFAVVDLGAPYGRR